MPDKEGSDDEKKSTKSVVNKKQKQMMGEEGYDIARDMGKVRPSKDKKDATTMPVSKEMRKTQKVNKGPSALELVKKKYGKAVMNVGKKKANEELDLTQVAEAFGGYIVEKSEIRKIKGKTYFYPEKGEKTKARELLKKLKKKGDETKPDSKKPIDEPSKGIEDFIASPDPFNPEKGAAKAKETAKKQIEKDKDDDPRFSDERKEREGQFSTGPTGQKFKEPVSGTPKAKGFTAKPGTQKFAEFPGAGPVKIIKPGTKPKSSTPPKFTSDQIRASQDAKRQQKGKDRIIDVDAGETTGELERTASAKIEKPQKETKKPRSATKASPAELRQTRREIERSQAAPENQVVLSPVKTMGKDGVMRNRPLPAFGSQMSDYFKQSPAGQAKLKGIDAETGKKFDMTNPKDYDKYMKVIGSSKRAKDSAKFRTQSPDSAITRTGGMTRTGSDNVSDERTKRTGITPLPPPLPPKKSVKEPKSAFAMAIQKADKFVQKNPVIGGVTGLAAYDLGKGVLGKILNIRKLTPGVVGGTVGRRSARGGGGL